MIRSVHRLYVPRSERDFNALVDLFDSLGLSHGESWQGRRSQGIKLEAPSAGVEIGMGQGFPKAGVVIEADSADVVYELARKRRWKIVEKLKEYDWGARMFTLELPGRGGRVAVFSYTAPPPEQGKVGELDARGRRFGVVVSRFNAFITERLLAGALDGLRRSGASKDDIEIVRVPGAFEVPIAARKLAQSGRFDAIICLGCILRGETSHYEHIANEVTRGIGQSAQETGVAHTYGVLTCDTLEQAIDRAGLKSGNKGFDAALSAVEMASLAGSRQSAVVSKAGRRQLSIARKAAEPVARVKKSAVARKKQAETLLTMRPLRKSKAHRRGKRTAKETRR